MKERIVTIIFIAIIVFVGISTAVKSGGAVLKMKGLNTEGWININGAFQRAVGSTYVKDPSTDVYKLDDGSIIYNMDRMNVKDMGERIAALGDYIERSGSGKFVYVQLPYKIQSDDVLPMGMKAYGNYNADDLVKRLSSHSSVHVIDIRDYVRKENKRHTDLFYKTDHHWLPQTAMWAAGIIAGEMNDKYAMPVNPEFYEMGNYNVKNYKDYFLGSLGKRTGKYYGGVDDFQLLTPKWETDFTFDAESAKGHIHREGDFSESLCTMDNIKEKDYFKYNCYVTYIGGDYKINKVVNNKVKNDAKVLLIRDSFSCALEPFICNQYKYVTAVDLRYYDADAFFNDIEKNDYDIVIMAFNPSAFDAFDKLDLAVPKE